MLSAGEWVRSQQNLITFVMVDSLNNEVSGLGTGFNLFVSKAGGAFNPSAGTKAEIGNGWYSYLSTAAEADTLGAVSIYVTGAGATQQNLEYVVQARNAGCSEFTYTVTDSVTTNPIEGAEVWFTTDVAGSVVVWYGTTDALGVARDGNGNIPCLDPGTYYVWKQIGGYVDDDNPDTEVVT